MIEDITPHSQTHNSYTPTYPYPLVIRASLLWVTLSHNEGELSQEIFGRGKNLLWYLKLLFLVLRSRV